MGWVRRRWEREEEFGEEKGKKETQEEGKQEERAGEWTTERSTASCMRVMKAAPVSGTCCNQKPMPQFLGRELKITVRMIKRALPGSSLRIALNHRVNTV